MVGLPDQHGSMLRASMLKRFSFGGRESRLSDFMHEAFDLTTFNLMTEGT